MKQKDISIYFKRRAIKDDELDLNKSLKSLFNQLRISNHRKYPNYFYLHKKNSF